LLVGIRYRIAQTTTKSHAFVSNVFQIKIRFKSVRHVYNTNETVVAPAAYYNVRNISTITRLNKQLETKICDLPSVGVRRWCDRRRPECSVRTLSSESVDRSTKNAAYGRRFQNNGFWKVRSTWRFAKTGLGRLDVCVRLPYSRTR